MTYWNVLLLSRMCPLPRFLADGVHGPVRGRVVIVDQIDTIWVQEFPQLLFVELHTSDGIVGLGETSYDPLTVQTHIHERIAPKLLGQRPLNIELLGMACTGYVGFAGTGTETRARSAVDIALWDILGKVAGLPVCDLLGGRTRERIRVYNTCAGIRYARNDSGQTVANWEADDPDASQYEDLYGFLHYPDRLAQELLASGIRGMKIWPFDPYAEATAGNYVSRDMLRRALEPLERIRASVGGAIDIMVDLHGLWNLSAARRVAEALEPYEPSWIEDPLRPDIVGGMAALAHDTRITIAAGETVAGRTGFLPLLADDAVGVVTVDPTWTGGLSEARKIATLAESFGIPIAPHDCTGPVALTACTHLSCSAPNAVAQEFVRAAYFGWYRTLVTDLPPVDNGTIAPPDGPGLGTTLRPDLRNRPDVVTRTSSLESGRPVVG
jgi:galactonate dehydratase